MTRKSDYNEEIADEICSAIATGTESIEKLCKKNPHWPHRATIFRWINQFPAFCEAYTRAKKSQIEAYIDQVIDIADDASQDWVVNENGTTVGNHEHINRARLRIDTRKWLACKLVPRLYGDNKEDKNNSEDAISQFRVES